MEMGMELPLVSILVPVYRVEDYIERCARSLFEQTYECLEYIFVDDASPDKSIDILEKTMSDYPQRKSYTKIIHHSENKGLAAARNTAVAGCHGQFIFHVDSDDWVEHNAVELLVNKQKVTNADIVTGQAVSHQADIVKPCNSGNGDLDKHTMLFQVLTYQLSTSIWRRLIKRSLYIDNHIKANENGSLGEDYQVFPCLLYYANRISFIDNCIYHYNKDNLHSLMNSIQSNVDIQKQGYVSACVIVDFFSDKDSHLKSIAHGQKIKYLLLRMKQNCSQGNRKGYKYFHDILLTCNFEEWQFVKWNQPLRRYIDSHYYILKMVLGYNKAKRFINSI